MRTVKKYLPHFTVALALSVAVIIILDEFNPMMNWVTSSQSKLLMIIFCISATVTAVTSIIKG